MVIVILAVLGAAVIFAAGYVAGSGGFGSADLTVSTDAGGPGTPCDVLCRKWKQRRAEAWTSKNNGKSSGSGTGCAGSKARLPRKSVFRFSNIFPNSRNARSVRLEIRSLSLVNAAGAGLAMGSVCGHHVSLPRPEAASASS